MYRAVLIQWICGVALGWFSSTLMGQTDFHSPPIEDCISVRVGATGQAIHWDQMMMDLATADVVFLGETHDDDTTHRVEWAVYEGLLARRDSKVVLALEMFERDVQPQLDEYLAGKIDEKAFLASARPWQNYHEAYRPMVEKAKSVGAPVVASNFPRPIRMKMMGDAEKALQSLGNDRGLAPAEFLPNSEVYWKRTDNAVRGHLGMMQAMEGADRRYSTQSLWDNSMGESCALALDRNPGFSVVHVNGGFHTSYWDGTAGQLKKRKPDCKIKTVSIVPATSPSSERLKGAPVADYVVLAEQLATNINEEKWSVFVNRKTDYQLHVPANASPENRVPLLIWLGSDGQASGDGLKFWHAALGEQAAVLVLDPPFRELQRDLSNGGRWFWADSFSEDVSAMIAAIERSWSYALERYPIDPNRVCLAGEGTGATVVAATTLLTDRMSVNSVAIQPRQYAKIKDFPLPLLEDWGTEQPPRRALQIIASPFDGEWWKGELKEYETVGLSARWADADVDPWSHFEQVDHIIRDALSIEVRSTPENVGRRYVQVDSKSPLHLIWARLAAQRASTDGSLCVAVTNPPDSAVARPFSVTISPETLSNPEALPKCPGAFGGTTIMVIDAESDNAEFSRWLDLEKTDPLNKSSRFHRLRIATSGAGDHGLANVLKTLFNEKRTNVLIVPATFYAGEGLMRELETNAANFADRMTIQWLPGLGGQKLPLSE